MAPARGAVAASVSPSAESASALPKPSEGVPSEAVSVAILGLAGQPAGDLVKTSTAPFTPLVAYGTDRVAAIVEPSADIEMLAPRLVPGGPASVATGDSLVQPPEGLVKMRT